MESYHEKYRLSISVRFELNFYGLATETVNIHERVNNAQAPAHQMQSSSTPAAIQGAAPRMAGMDQHEQAIIVHETMNNGSADAHKKWRKVIRR